MIYFACVQNTGHVCPVYALNSTSVRLMDWPVYGELDSIESYFWREKDCIPFQGNRFTVNHKS